MDAKNQILLVEDEVNVIEPVRMKLQSAGFNVVTASDGDEALENLTKQVPDLILLDLVMPNRNGYSVLEQIRGNELWTNIPVMVFSNLGGFTDVKEAREKGADAYLLKANTTLDQLLEKVRILLSVGRTGNLEQYASVLWP